MRQILQRGKRRERDAEPCEPNVAAIGAVCCVQRVNNPPPAKKCFSSYRRHITNMKLHLLLLSISSICHRCNGDDASVSIAISPIVLQLQSSSDTTAWTPDDLDVVALAAEKYIDGNNLLELALERTLNADLQYDGVEFKASSNEQRRLLLRSRLVTSSLANDVVLEGSVKLSAAQDINPLDDAIPTEAELTDVVMKLFRNGEQLFVKKLGVTANKEGASEWLMTVTGYDALLLNGVSGGDVNTLQGSQVNSDEEGNSSNIFIIIGIVGAAVSFLLLIGGLCYAKKVYSKDGNHQSGGQLLNTPQKSSKPSFSMTGSPSSRNSPAKSAQSVPPPPPVYDEDHEDQMSDDESNANFMLARAALGNPVSPSRPKGSASVASNANTFADDMSYAFSVEVDSVAAATKMTTDDDVIAGGVSSFQNDRGGTFQWNEDGTKMVYIPAEDSDASKMQNGFVYDDAKKKWVVAEKNVSFQSAVHSGEASSSIMTPPRRIQRTRTEDSGVTGVSEFTYDDVALDFAKRMRSDESSTYPSSPRTPGAEEEGVEVMAESAMDFMMDDDSTAFGSIMTGMTGYTNQDSLIPPPPPADPFVTSQRAPSHLSSDEPGRIPHITRIGEDTPFDEDIPFDERPKKVDASTNLRIPRVMDLDDMSNSDGSQSSQEVLDDLNHLSQFMIQRKRSSKSTGSRTKGSFGSSGNSGRSKGQSKSRGW